MSGYPRIGTDRIVWTEAGRAAGPLIRLSLEGDVYEGRLGRLDLVMTADQIAAHNEAAEARVIRDINDVVLIGGTVVLQAWSVNQSGHRLNLGSHRSHVALETEWGTRVAVLDPSGGRGPNAAFAVGARRFAVARHDLRAAAKAADGRSLRIERIA